MADFAEAVLHLQAYKKIKSDTNWKEIQHVLQCYHTVQEYSEENEVLKQLCNNIFDEDFLKILSDHLVKIETIDKNTVNCINQILLKFDVVSRFDLSRPENDTYRTCPYTIISVSNE